MKKIITIEVLNIYDKYDGDFGLLDEPWASKKDRTIVNFKQSKILSEYVDLLNFIKSNTLKENDKAFKELTKLEEYIESDVVNILKKRFNEKKKEKFFLKIFRWGSLW